ncbi:MAG: SAM-dependent methyltransferase, partial [Cyanobacteria bacterium P01_G01_bin.49]
ASIGVFLGLIPLVKVFTSQELENSLSDAGFTIDYHWQPNKSIRKGMFKLKGVFIVAKKA